MSEQQLIKNIIRQAEILIEELEGTFRQRAEGIRAVALLLQQHEKERNQCEECEGSGVIINTVARPHSPSRDVGVIDEIETTCQECQGSGRNDE